MGFIFLLIIGSIAIGLAIGIFIVMGKIVFAVVSRIINIIKFSQKVNKDSIG